jgi:hypothetical protein
VVDRNSVHDTKAGPPRQFNIRNRANSRNDSVKCQAFPASQRDRRRIGRNYYCIQMQMDTLISVTRRHQVCDLWRHSASQDLWAKLKHRHIRASKARCSGQFQPNKAGTYDADPLPIGQTWHKMSRIIHGAQRVTTDKGWLGPRPRPCGDEQFVVGQDIAAELQMLPRWMDCIDLNTSAQINAGSLIIRGCMDQLWL